MKEPGINKSIELYHFQVHLTWTFSLPPKKLGMCVTFNFLGILFDLLTNVQVRILNYGNHDLKPSLQACCLVLTYNTTLVIEH